MTDDLFNRVVAATVEGMNANPALVDLDVRKVAKRAIRQADAIADELAKEQALSFTAAEALRSNGERGR